MTDPSMVLASASPRRSEILRLLGIGHRCVPAHVPEPVVPGEAPEAHVERLARAKAEVVAREVGDALVLGGDTVVVMDGRVMEKPAGPEDAVDMLVALSGRSHEVFTGLALTGPAGTASGVGRAVVRFRDFGSGEARAYVATGEPLDKAGAYGIQGRGAALVAAVEGDYYAVVGLSVAVLVRLLEVQGWRYMFGRLVPVETAPPTPRDSMRARP